MPCLCRFPFVVWYRFWVLPSRVLSCVLSAWGAMAHATAEEGAASREATRQAGWRRREPGRWWFGSSAAAGYGPTATVACCYIDEAADAWVLDEVTVVVIVARRTDSRRGGDERRGGASYTTRSLSTLCRSHNQHGQGVFLGFPNAPGWAYCPKFHLSIHCPCHSKRWFRSC